MLGKKKAPKKLKTREDKIQEELEKHGYNLDGHEEDKKLHDFIDTIKDSELDYTDYIARNIDKYGHESLDVKKNNNVFNQYLLIQCVEPIRQGMSVQNIAKSIGMFAGLALLNEDFRSNAKSIIREVVAPHLDEYVKNNPDSRWVKFRNQMAESGEIPLNPDSVAVMKIGMIKKAYKDLRDPEKDNSKVIAEYNKADELLYRQAEADGLSPEAVDTSTRILVGRLLERHPDQAMYFEELAYGDLQRSKDKTKTIFIDGEAVEMNVWGGEFESEDGEQYTGSFTPRWPQGAEYHSDAMFNDTYKYFEKEGANEESLQSYIEETRLSSEPGYRFLADRKHPTYMQKLMAKDDLPEEVFGKVSVDISTSIASILSNEPANNYEKHERKAERVKPDVDWGKSSTEQRNYDNINRKAEEIEKNGKDDPDFGFGFGGKYD